MKKVLALWRSFVTKLYVSGATKSGDEGEITFQRTVLKYSKTPELAPFEISMKYRVIDVVDWKIW